MAEDESSKKKQPMSLNQLQNRFISSSRSKPYSDFPSEMKNRKLLQKSDVPSFNITDSDSPSPELKNRKPEGLDAPLFNIVDFDSPSSEDNPSKVMNEEILSSRNHDKDCENDGSLGESISSLEDDSAFQPVGIPSKVINEDKLPSASHGDDGEDSASFVEPITSVVDDFTSQAEGDKDRPLKVKIQGRRRLCKIVQKDDSGEEMDRFNDVQSNISAAVSKFDSPSPVKNTAESICNGGDEIRDILSNLSSKFEILSIEKRRRPIEQLPSSSGSVIKERISQKKPEEFSENVGIDTSCSLTANQSSSLPKATPTLRAGNGTTNKANGCSEDTVCKASRIENSNDGYAKKQVGKVVTARKIVGSGKHDEDDDDCVVASGQNFLQKVESRRGKFKLESDLSDEVHVLDNDTDNYVSGDGIPFTLNNPNSTYKLPSKIANILYPHQRDGLKWLWSLHCKGKGGILGDDMGLGKTMQICGFLVGLFHSNLIKRVLIVAPKTLLPHWMKELAVVGLSGMTREYFGTCAKARQYELQYILQDKGVLLTTYDIVRNNVKSLSGDYDETDEDAMTWDYMILDEGHLIKNPSTQRAKSLLAIPSAHRIIISGTPLQNNLKELWALFNFCCPELLGDKQCFKEKYESAILRGNDKNASDRDKRIGSAVAQDLRACIQPYFLRRLKSDVFREDDATNTAKLSKKNEIIVWLRLTGIQRRLYEAFLKSEIVLSAFDGSPLAALTILKKICDHPLLLTKRAAEDVLEGMEELNREDHGVAEKLAMHIADVAERYDFEENNDNLSCKISFILALLGNLIPEGHTVLIFSQTRKMLNLIQDSLIANGYKFLRIDGTTKASDRLKIVNDFQEGVGAPIFLLTSQVGGLGLTLTKADRVIVVDPAWNPSTDNQSVDRAYRIGQKKDVLVYRLMTCSTVEEKIYRKQIYKGGLFRSATEHKEQIRYFSQQDLRELFSLPKQGFDISLTQRQLHEEHDCDHKMDPSLKIHIKFLESLGIAGISHHSLLFSKTAPVPVVEDDEVTRARQSTFVGGSFSRSSQEPNVDAAQYAFNPKDVVVHRKNFSPNYSSKLTESEIKEQIKRLSTVFANKAMVAKLSDKGEKIQKQIAELNLELDRIRMAKRSETETIDLDGVVEGFQRVLNV